jgi:predicted house-cleaning noncanonical NTP pyrophosphatase (MazG superfamily)
LVRDKIPESIIAKGGQPKTRVLDEKEIIKELNRKLEEEVQEYLADESM